MIDFYALRMIILVLILSVTLPADVWAYPSIMQFAHTVKNLLLRKKVDQIVRRNKVHIAVVPIRSGIYDETDLVKKLYELRTDDSIHGILLWVSSPGGAPGPSWLISQEIAACKKKKPVVVIIGDTCTSGAFLVAARADYIIAPSLSEVGSIGVLYTVRKNKVEKFKGVDGTKGDATIEVIASSPNKVVTNPYGPSMNDEQRAALAQHTYHLYELFYQEVARARKLDPEKHLEWADAQVFSGDRALALGLIDSIGSYSDAIEKLLELIKERLQVEGEPVLIPIEASCD